MKKNEKNQSMYSELLLHCRMSAAYFRRFVFEILYRRNFTRVNFLFFLVDLVVGLRFIFI